MITISISMTTTHMLSTTHMIPTSTMPFLFLTIILTLHFHRLLVLLRHHLPVLHRLHPNHHVLFITVHIMHIHVHIHIHMIVHISASHVIVVTHAHVFNVEMRGMVHTRHTVR